MRNLLLREGLLLALIFIGLLLFGTMAAHAQDAPPPSVHAQDAQPPAMSDEHLFPEPTARAVSTQSEAVERLRKSVERLQTDDAGLAAQRGELEALIADATLTKNELGPLVARLDEQIKGLGPAPKEGEAAEAPELAAERSRLETIRGRLIAAQKRTDLTIVRSEQLIRQIQQYRFSNFTEGVLQRSTSPLSPQLWRDVGSALPRVGTQLATIVDNWYAAARAQTGILVFLLLFGGFCYLVLSRLRRRFLAERLVEPVDPHPGFLTRVGTASWVAPLMALPSSATALLLFAGGDASSMWGGPTRALAITVVGGWLIYAASSALATAILLPKHESWRLLGTPSDVSKRLLFGIRLLAGSYAIDFCLHQTISLFHIPVVVGVLETSIASLVFAALLVMFAWTPMPSDIERPSGRMVKSALFWLRIPILLIALAIVLATLLGYVSLGRFLSSQIMLMGCGGMAMLLLHLGIRALLAQPADVTQPVERILENKPFLSDERRQQIAGVLAFILNALLVVVALVLLLLSWGIPQSQLADAFRALFFGFEVGGLRISLVQIIIGVALFVALLFVTRMVQRWLRNTVLSAQRMDAGIANSLHTVVGYVGMGIAALIGISYAGIDLTNVTLVVGALSLGVGLGLQSIVNNFVSGLILLIERPVKVGDWVVIGDQQGYVRKISVRATEVETFDRASVIVPNSELISGVVQNWTHRNAMGRVVVAVGVSYASDPEEVRAHLLDIASNTDGVLGFPAPFVAFEDFGASSLDFTLRCHVADVNTSLTVKTALRMAIFARFKDHNIEIPFPQQDVHLRDLDPVRAMLTRAAEERAQAASDKANDVTPKPPAGRVDVNGQSDDQA